MLDLAGPAGAFEAANRELGRPAYRITVLAAEAGAVTNSLAMTIAPASVDEAVPDTLMVVGGRLDPPPPADTLGRLAETASRTRRVASICVGAFTLAASVDLAPKNDRIAAALGYARDHIAEALTVERLAGSAGMSLRQFTRAFRAQTGTTPARVVERLRTDLARGRIETTGEPVERIAEAVGFGDAENMRRAFIRLYGQPPQSIRRATRS